jgi:orotidine-5'-phosphate decarboxylase
MIIDRLIDKINEKQSPIVIGLDTTIDVIPESFKNIFRKNLPVDTIETITEIIFQYNAAILNYIEPFISIIKINPSCYELYSHYGIVCLEKTIFYAQQLGLLVIVDSKKNDVGHTAELYAKAAFSPIPLLEGNGVRFGPDFITVNPYLGSDGIDPFVKEAEKQDKGIFVLCRTSNPSANQYQKSRVFNECGIINDDYLYEKIAKDMSGHKLNPKSGYSVIGLVVGINHVKSLKKVRQKAKRNYFLCPGYGDQGGLMVDAMYAFNNDGYGALIHSSRSVIAAHQNEKYIEQFPDEETRYILAAKQEVKNMRENILIELLKANKSPSNW